MLRKRVARSTGTDRDSIREAVEAALRYQVITAQRVAVRLQMVVGHAGKLRPASPSPLALGCSDHEHPGG